MPAVKGNGSVCRGARPVSPLARIEGECYNRNLTCEDTLIITAHVDANGKVTSRTFQGPADPEFAECLRRPAQELWFEPAYACDGQPVAGTWQSSPQMIICDASVSLPEVK